MTTPDLRERLRAANPVPRGETEPLSPADERLLAHILATPRRRRAAFVVRLMAPAAVAAATVALLVLLVVHPSAEVPPGTSGAFDAPAGAILHIVTQRYSRVVTGGRLVPDGRAEGWAQASTGRARLVDRAQNGRLREQIVVDRNGRVTRWLRVGSPQKTVRRSPSLAAADRLLVTDRIDALVRQDFAGAMSATELVRRYHRTLRTRYAGRAAIEREVVSVARVAVGDPTAGRLAEQGFFARTFRDARTGAPLGFERGECKPDGSHATVIMGERVLVHEVLKPGRAERQLAWRSPA